MGLKTNNYVSKSTGIVLPEAYAILTNLIVESNNNARAIFAIQSSREATKQYKALDKVEINFTWDRKTDPAIMAYETAKTQTIKLEKYNEVTGEFVPTIEFGTLYGWQDDKV
jgi:hypothetical protein